MRSLIVILLLNFLTGSTPIKIEGLKKEYKAPEIMNYTVYNKADRTVYVYIALEAKLDYKTSFQEIAVDMTTASFKTQIEYPFRKNTHRTFKFNPFNPDLVGPLLFKNNKLEVRARITYKYANSKREYNFYSNPVLLKR
jgi:hypothetical protein